MNWKGIVAIVLLVGLGIGAGVWVGSCQGNSRFLEKDAKRAAEVIQLREAQAQDRARAATMSEELQGKDKTIAGLRSDVAASKSTTDALRRKVRNRPVQAGCEDCEALVKKLDLTITLQDKMAFEQADALKLCEDRDIVRLGELEKCKQVDDLQSERLSDWKKQTRRGRVKTAFLAIGVGLGSGAIGYGVGRATQ